MLSRSRFDALVSQWKKDHAGLSFHRQNHPAFEELVAAGKDIIPFVLDFLIKEDSWLALLLLRQLVGTNPYIKRNMAGNYRKLKRAWLKWAENSEYAKYLVLL